MLKKVRTLKGLSQSQLATESGVNLKMIQKYEQHVKDLNAAKFGTLLMLCNTLECDLRDLITDPELQSLIEVYEKRRKRHG